MIFQNFNANWKVEKGSKDSRMNSFLGKTDIKEVHLPYDAMIHEERDPNTPNGAQTGFYPGGEYIFQKTFDVPSDWKGKSVFVNFEGVYQIALVYVNGILAYKSVNGYIDFTVDMTPYLKYGQENLIKVIADNSLMPNSRWYSGSGIYRNVSLMVAEKVYIPMDGVKVTTKEIGDNYSNIEVLVNIKNNSNITERIKVNNTIKKDEKSITCDSQKLVIYPNESKSVRFSYCINNPKLWSTETPDLYKSVCTLEDEDGQLDISEDMFGIRTISIDAIHGLQINGETVKLRGACIHHDNGLIGATSLQAAEEYRCTQLKRAGFNAIRSSHNPASRALLDVCDRIGLLVMDELSDVWNIRKNPYDYALYFKEDWEKTTEKIVSKDYNHPCVILYCIGNEISEAGSESGAITNKMICDKFKELDSTRYTTNALNGLMAAGYRLRDIMKDVATKFPVNQSGSNGNGAGSSALNSFMSLMAGEKGDYFSTHPLLTEALSGCSDSLDVIGLNYLTGRHEYEHEIHPNKTVLGTETYPADIARLWNIVENNNHVIGDFTWAGYDYLGEAGCGIFHYDGNENFSSIYPERLAYIGDIDLIGYRRPISYLREIVYGLRKQPYIAVNRMEHNGQTCTKTPWMFKDNISSWNWDEFDGQEASVDVYSNAQEVELFLNDKSLGKKEVKDYIATYPVPYASGTLKAVSYVNGKEESEFTLSTAVDAKLTINTTKDELLSNGEDLVYCLIHYCDANGNEDLHSKHKIKVNVEGQGTLEGLGSANPSSEERYDTDETETYDGYCLAIIRSKEEAGNIKVTITSDESETKEINIVVK